MVYLNEQKWQAWAKEHNCQLVGVQSPSYMTSVDSKGVVNTTMIAGKKGWSCDDGVTYWR